MNTYKSGIPERGLGKKYVFRNFLGSNNINSAIQKESAWVREMSPAIFQCLEIWNM